MIFSSLWFAGVYAEQYFFQPVMEPVTPSPKHLHMKNYLLLLGWLACAPLYSQNAVTVNGVLKDAQNGETLIGATVEAVGLSKGNVSNEYGFYSFSLPAGQDSVTLRFSYIGYETQLKRVKPVSNLKLDISLAPVGSVLTEVVIKANALDEKRRSTEMSVATIGTKEIKALPALFGETDVIKILQLKPGLS